MAFALVQVTMVFVSSPGNNLGLSTAFFIPPFCCPSDVPPLPFTPERPEKFQHSLTSFLPLAQSPNRGANNLDFIVLSLPASRSSCRLFFLQQLQSPGGLCDKQTSISDMTFFSYPGRVYVFFHLGKLVEGPPLFCSFFYSRVIFLTRVEEDFSLISIFHLNCE